MPDYGQQLNKYSFSTSGPYCWLHGHCLQYDKYKEQEH